MSERSSKAPACLLITAAILIPAAVSKHFTSRQKQRQKQPERLVLHQQNTQPEKDHLQRLSIVMINAMECAITVK